MIYSSPEIRTVSWPVERLRTLVETPSNPVFDESRRTNIGIRTVGFLKNTTPTPEIGKVFSGDEQYKLLTHTQFSLVMARRIPVVSS